MKNIPKILAIIPARGGSKGVPGKNIKRIAGKPLIAYTILEARKSKYIHRLVVTTDDDKIKKAAEDFGAKVILRPPELAEDSTPTNPVLTHAVNFLAAQENYKPDIILLLQPTCCLRKAKHIDEAIQKFLVANYDCLISVLVLYKHRYEFKQAKYLMPVVKKRLRSQERKPIILENGAIYLSTLDLIKQEKIVAGKIGYYEMDYKSSINIDKFSDFEIAKQLIEYEKKQSTSNN